MNIIKAKKEQVYPVKLGLRVFHELIYGGKHQFVIVGIRQHEIELEGDFSGGTNTDFGHGKQWYPIKGAFHLIKICDSKIPTGNCPHHNLQCGYPVCEPYLDNWGHYVDGNLIDKVELL